MLSTQVSDPVKTIDFSHRVVEAVDVIAKRPTSITMYIVQHIATYAFMLLALSFDQ